MRTQSKTGLGTARKQAPRKAFAKANRSYGRRSQKRVTHNLNFGHSSGGTGPSSSDLIGVVILFAAVGLAAVLSSGFGVRDKTKQVQAKTVIIDKTAYNR